MGDKVEAVSVIIRPEAEKDEDSALMEEEEEMEERPPRNEEAVRKTASTTKGLHNKILGIEEKPNRAEVIGWYLYEFCSYFIVTTLIPIVFPLIISQTVDSQSR